MMPILPPAALAIMTPIKTRPKNRRHATTIVATTRRKRPRPRRPLSATVYSPYSVFLDEFSAHAP